MNPQGPGQGLCKWTVAKAWEHILEPLVACTQLGVGEDTAREHGLQLEAFSAPY